MRSISSAHGNELFQLVYRFVLNDSLRPLPPRASEPSNAISDAASTPNSSLDSSDSYKGDDARCFLREWRVARDHYSKATWENGQLEIHLGASQATLHATEEEASAAQARLAESDAMVAGKMDSRNTFILISTVFILIAFLLL